MKKITKATTLDKEKVYKLKSAIIKDYEYTKSYYHLEDGVPVKSDTGNDHDLTVIHISKRGVPSNSKRSFIFTDGYIGAERSYNEDGTKKKSVARKNCFGMEYLIKYIENGENCVDDFNIVFFSDKEKSENQADLFAQVVKDVTKEDTTSTYMWCHSKGGLFALRAFQKMREEGNQEEVLKKLKPIITSMPTQGTDSVNRPKMIDSLDKNKFVNILPFSGFIKTIILKSYDKYLYKPTPAQVDLKTPYETKETSLMKPPSAIRKVFDKIWGNDTFKKQVLKEKQVDYDSGYLPRVTSEENMSKINDINYKVLPVNIDFKGALDALIKHAQIMPFILYTKKILTTKDKGDGLITMENQGIDDKKFKFQKDIVVNATHDVPTTPEALGTIKDELFKLDEEKNQDEGR